MIPLRVFCGYDEREAIGFHVFVHSLVTRASVPLSIIPLAAMGLPQGSNAFTLSRFLVPWLCGFRGMAIFADASDMLAEADIAQLAALYDPRYAVQLVKHPDYSTRHPIKYRGTPMQCENRNYSRKNWASLMLMNCEHPTWQSFTPDGVASRSALASLQFQHLQDSQIGVLPSSWNVLMDEGQESEGARLLHFSSGIPAFPLYRTTRGSREWFRAFDQMNAAIKA